MPSRTYDQWGKRPWQLQGMDNYPQGTVPPGMPSGREAWSAIQSAGQQLGIWGSAGVSQPAQRASSLAMMINNNPALKMMANIASGGAFSRNFTQSQMNQLNLQLGELRLQQAQMEMHGQRAVDQANQELEEFSKIWAEWSLGKDKPNGMTDEEAERQVLSNSILAQNPHIASVMQQGGMGAVEEYLKYLDAQVNNLQAGITGSKKGSKSGSESMFSSDDPEGGALPHREETRFAGATPTTPAKTDDPTANETPEQTIERLTRPRSEHGVGINREGIDFAAQNIDNDEAFSKLSATDKHKAMAAASQLKSSMQRIAAERTPADEDIKPTDKDYGKKMRDRALDKLDKIGKLSPTIGGILHDMYNYNYDIDKIPRSQRAFLDGLLSSATDHHWNSSNYRRIQDLIAEKGPNQQIMTRISEFSTAGLTTLWGAVKDTRKDPKFANATIPERSIDEIIAGKWTGDPRWSKLYTAINSAINQVGGIMSLTGHTYVTTAQTWMKENAPNKSPAQILEQFHVDFNDAWAIINDKQQTWNRLTGRDTLIPNVSPEKWNIYSAFARANWTHGTMPDDAPPELRAVSTPMGKPVAGGDNKKPMTVEEMRGYQELYKKYYHDPATRAARRAELDELSSYFPSTISPAMETPPSEEETRF
jgi:hypothetical protein